MVKVATRRLKTFKEWMQTQQDRQDPIGDLARDMTAAVLWNEPKQPRKAPLSLADYYRWHVYLVVHCACDGAFQALALAYRECAATQGMTLRISRQGNIALPSLVRAQEEERQAARTLTPAERFAILKRDNYRCRLCGVSARDDSHVRLEADHITPRSQGGTHDPSNLWTLCFPCNRGKGTQEP